ncbi:MAG: endolytic transglycosylase MltG [Janthinobacterium lividum]
MRARRLQLVRVFAVLLLLLGILLISPWWTWHAVAGRSRDVVIPAGTTLSGAAGRLDAAGLIQSAWQFRLLARLFGEHKPIKAGVYRFVEGQGWSDYLRRMQRGDVIALRITIPEGMPSVLVRERLLATPNLTGPAPLPVEGSVLPDTYNFQVGSSRAAALIHMQEAMKTELAALWRSRNRAAVVKSPAEAVTLASIVEKETGKADERRLVAGVYSNRLREGIKLDADPTVIYPITAGKPLGRRIRLSELRAINGYNTYAKVGLPIGPIANPGKASIAAVLDPAPTLALYFVADGTGGHVFADSLAEHNKNVAKWFALRRSRGEM